MERSLSKRVVVAESFAEQGLAILRQAGITVDSMVGRPRDDLKASLGTADGLIVRSETRVDRDLLAAGPKLTVVARAGVGVDSIDVAAATAAGVVVLNTPAANTISATEQTFGLMLSLARNIPQAVQSLREGRWDRLKLVGTELAGKTLGIVGLGRIGGNIATRARAFGMTVQAHDPYIAAARADAFDAKLVDLETLLRTSDVVTLHVPLTGETRGMIDLAKLRLLQKHAYIINCARGGVIVEEDLLVALDEGSLAGAGINVVAVEPPPPDGPGARLHEHPKVVPTPHLGGSTHEALARIANELAEDVTRVLLGAPGMGAVDAPVPDGSEAERVLPFLDVAYRIGPLLPAVCQRRRARVVRDALAEAIWSRFRPKRSCAHSSPVCCRPRPIAASRSSTRKPSPASRACASKRVRMFAPTPYAGSLRISGGSMTVTGTSVNGQPRIVEAGGLEIDMPPLGDMLVTQRHDEHGMIGPRRHAAR